VRRYTLRAKSPILFWPLNAGPRLNIFSVD
jgi:hypothetical protein